MRSIEARQTVSNISRLRITCHAEVLICEDENQIVAMLAGDVVLYHAKLMHVPMFNNSVGCIRQAVITGFGLTEEALPEQELYAHVDERDLWRDWAPVVRATPEAAAAARL